MALKEVKALREGLQKVYLELTTDYQKYLWWKAVEDLKGLEESLAITTRVRMYQHDEQISEEEQDIAIRICEALSFALDKD